MFNDIDTANIAANGGNLQPMWTLLLPMTQERQDFLLLIS
jgi:hypothetical protein